MFPRIEYLDWIRGRPGAARFDLGSSDLRDGADPDATLDDLLDLEPPPEDVGLEEQVADVYGTDPSAVLVTAGATHANALAMAAVSGGPPAVAVERPGYEPLVATPRGFGAQVERFERPADDGYALDPAAAEPALAAADLAVVTDRHNPSGRRADRDALADLAARARDHGTRLLVDEVYAPYGRAVRSEVGFGAGSAAGIDGVVATGSLTKFFGLGDLRIGWLLADPGVVERARAALEHFPSVSGTSRRLARRALHHADDLAARKRDRIAANADRLAAFVDGRDDLRGTVHPGCTIALLEHERADGDAVAAAAWDAGILVVPGRFFDSPDRFRISAARDPATIADGLEALGDVLDSL